MYLTRYNNNLVILLNISKDMVIYLEENII